ncbi:hypothetical protein RF11_01029 [Thelohanellus kitauei]|uniref:Uncharacterized protein n=1 Tax=Thelohanellus kitauei TaxID=669202 RepID=A0A0C2J0S9_THEKT|nr:hypothetical protein RF11_01029 [Thelohanellus kitauei]
MAHASAYRPKQPTGPDNSLFVRHCKRFPQWPYHVLDACLPFTETYTARHDKTGKKRIRIMDVTVIQDSRFKSCQRWKLHIYLILAQNNDALVFGLLGSIHSVIQDLPRFSTRRRWSRQTSKKLCELGLKLLREFIGTRKYPRYQNSERYNEVQAKILSVSVVSVSVEYYAEDKTDKHAVLSCATSINFDDVGVDHRHNSPAHKTLDSATAIASARVEKRELAFSRSAPCHKDADRSDNDAFFDARRKSHQNLAPLLPHRKPSKAHSPDRQLFVKSATLAAAILKFSLDKHADILGKAGQFPGSGSIEAKLQLITNRTLCCLGCLSSSQFLLADYSLTSGTLGLSETSFCPFVSIGRKHVRSSSYAVKIKTRNGPKNVCPSTGGIEEIPSFAPDVLRKPVENNFMGFDTGQACPTGACPLTANSEPKLWFKEARKRSIYPANNHAQTEITQLEPAKVDTNFQFIPVETNETQTNEGITVAAVAAVQRAGGPCTHFIFRMRGQPRDPHQNDILSHSNCPTRDYTGLMSKDSNDKSFQINNQSSDILLNPLELSVRNEITNDLSSDFTGLIPLACPPCKVSIHFILCFTHGSVGSKIPGDGNPFPGQRRARPSRRSHLSAEYMLTCKKTGALIALGVAGDSSKSQLDLKQQATTNQQDLAPKGAIILAPLQALEDDVETTPSISNEFPTSSQANRPRTLGTEPAQAENAARNPCCTGTLDCGKDLIYKLMHESAEGLGIKNTYVVTGFPSLFEQAPSVMAMQAVPHGACPFKSASHSLEKQIWEQAGIGCGDRQKPRATEAGKENAYPQTAVAQKASQCSSRPRRVRGSHGPGDIVRRASKRQHGRPRPSYRASGSVQTTTFLGSLFNVRQW